MIILKIPYEFISQRAKICWNDILFAIEHQLVTPELAIDKAKEISSNQENILKEESELASSPKDEPVVELVSRLASAEAHPTEEEISAKWLYLALAWLYNNRDSVADPLSIVEEIYADFDYPREIAPFIRYMPMVGPDLGSREKNEQRLYDYWKEYLDQAGKRWSRSADQ